MQLNTLRPAQDSKFSKKRVGRGIGSNSGKTAGRGHKGQKSRAGGYHKVGFEGGQMPLQRRLPKRGFYSRKAARYVEVRLSDLEYLKVDTVDFCSLLKFGIIPNKNSKIKIISSGELTRKILVSGLKITSGARAAVEKVGGSYSAK